MSHPNLVLPEVDSSRRPRILVVEDHELGLRSLSRLLGGLGYEITAVKDGAMALAAMEDDRTFDYVLTDLRLPDLDGREIVEAAHKLLTSARIGLITGWDFDPREQDRLGIEWVFLKPIDIQDLVGKLREARPGGA